MIGKGESEGRKSRDNGSGAVRGYSSYTPTPPPSPNLDTKQGGESLAQKVLVAGQRVDGEIEVMYAAITDERCDQLAFHESQAPNLLALGTRNTGKSTMMRWDAIMRCLAFPGFKALIVRRKMTDLRKSHLQFIDAETRALFGRKIYRETISDVKFPNGSLIQFSHCENDSDIADYLSSQWGAVYFDELSTFTLDQFLKISASCRTGKGDPYNAVVRAGSNTLGPGAAWMKAWFIDHSVDYGEFPDYNPDDFEVQYSSLEGNIHADVEDYKKRLRNLPEHVRRAWLNNEFVMEGAYFSDFRKTLDGQPWHCIPSVPTWRGVPLSGLPWVSVYRAVDWGYSPDPAVCLWIAMLPNRHSIVFKEEKWNRTLAKDVAKHIHKLSEGMHVIQTFCDPTMFVKTGTIEYSIGEIFEQNGVPLTPAQNDRELYGYSVHELLNTKVDDHPQLQIVEKACPNLVRTFPILQMDKNDPRKLADGDDHYVVSLAYFGMGKANPTADPLGGPGATPRWMRPKRQQSVYMVS